MPQDNHQANKSRMLELDALRGIAAISVVIYHYFHRYNQLYGHENLPVEWSLSGRYGVQLFFIVSGFVIFWTLNRIEKPIDFIVSRFSRLYPAYWASAILTFLIVYIFGLPGREVSIISAIGNMVMFHEYLSIPHIDGVYWTLTVELTFYFWVFILYLFGQLKRIEYFLLSIVIISTGQYYGLFGLPYRVNQIFFLKYASFFLAGICFYRIVNNIHARRSALILLISLLSTIYTHSIHDFFFFLAFYVIFFLAISGYLEFLSIKPFIFLGTISYSLYLIHQNIGYVIINGFYQNEGHPLLGIAASMSISITIATAFYFFIEKPSLAMIRGAYKNNPKIQRLTQKLQAFGDR